MGPPRDPTSPSPESLTWDIAYESRSNVVEVYIRRLRAKIDQPFGRTSLETVRGAGYRLRPE